MPGSEHWMQKLEEESEQLHAAVWISIRRPLLSFARRFRNRPLPLFASRSPRPLVSRCLPPPTNTAAACPLLARGSLLRARYPREGNRTPPRRGGEPHAAA